MPTECLLQSTPICLKLPPGFRFRPSEEELVGYFLQRKLQMVPTPGVHIPELEVFQREPWDLAGMQGHLGTKDLYFFVKQQADETTPKGYWKFQRTSKLAKEGGGESSLPAVKVTYMYFEGQAPKGKPTAWRMHQLRFSDSNPDKFRTDYSICHLTNLKFKEENAYRRRLVASHRPMASAQPNPLTAIDVVQSSSDSVGSDGAASAPSLSEASSSSSEGQHAHFEHGHGHSHHHNHPYCHGRPPHIRRVPHPRVVEDTVCVAVAKLATHLQVYKRGNGEGERVGEEDGSLRKRPRNGLLERADTASSESSRLPCKL